MRTQKKSMLTAYLLWLFLPGLGVHRMYLHRAMSGMFLALASVFGVGMLMIGAQQASADYVTVGGICLLAVLAWWILDAFFLPGLVQQLNEPNPVKSYVSLGAVDLDPSFTKTLARAGRDDSRQSTKSSIPDGYEMPWRKQAAEPSVMRYRTQDDPQDRDEA